ncbi:MAG: hypothetical protein ABWY04_12910 [Arthrobacter sp.]
MSNQPATAKRPDPFALKRPCGNCPFRTDRAPFLDRERAQDSADSLVADGSFPWHKTVDYSSEDGTGEITPESKHCAGALIVLEHEENPNQMMRIAERTGFYDRTKLVMDSPVPESMDEWVELHAGRWCRIAGYSQTCRTGRDGEPMRLEAGT